MAWLALYNFDDVGGSTVADLSGNGYDIDLTGQPGAQVSGLDTGAFGKTGAGTVALPDGLLAAAETDDRTMMFDALGTRSVWWVRMQDAGADTGTWGILSLDAANLITRARTQAHGSPTPVNSVIGVLSASVRHNYAITYKRSTGVLSRYYDGVLVGTQTFTAGTQLYVGADALDMGEFASTGPAIDNLRIADHCADATEIAALAGTPVTAPTTTVDGTAAGSGGGAGSAAGVPGSRGTATGFGGGTGAATGASESLVSAAGSGGGIGAATGVVRVNATASGAAGGFGEVFVAEPIVTPTPTIGSSGWNTLLAIIHEAREQTDYEAERAPLACPNDGEPLLSGPGDVLYCPYDGWQPF